MEKKDVNKKLDEFIDKYGINCDESTLDFMIRMNSSDMIFKQHLNTSKVIDCIIIASQIIMLIISIILDIVDIDIGFDIFVIIYNIIALILVFINNYVSNHFWNKANEDLSEIFKLLDIYKVRCRLDTIKEIEFKTGLNIENEIEKAKNKEQKQKTNVKRGKRDNGDGRIN